MSELAVSNDVLRESLRVAAPPALSTRLEQRMSAWLPTFERWLIGALYWFTERAAWQRGALSVALGALVGLSLAFAGAGALRAERRESRASAPLAAVVAPVALRPLSAPGLAPNIDALSAPAVVSAAQPAATEPLFARPESKPASKHRRKASRLHRRAASKTGIWTLPRPQRHSP